VACWSHVRRKFYDVHHAVASAIALEAMQRIDAQFAIESRIRGQSPKHRLVVRQQHARPLLDQLKKFLDTALGRISGKSTLAQAIRYGLSRWPALERYLTI
jgi:transposase